MMKRIGFPLGGRPGPTNQSKDARPGGADVSTLALAKLMTEAGFDPVILLHIDGPMAAYVKEIGIACQAVDIPVFDKRQPITEENYTYLRDSAPRIAKILEYNNIEIVHTNDASMHRAWGHLRQYIDFKHFWHERGLFQHPDISKEHMRAADEVITISNYVAGKAPQTVRERVTVVNNPVSVPPTLDKVSDRVWLRKMLQLETENLVFLMIANENKRKRWEIYFESALKTLEKRKDIHFVTVGLTKKDFIKECMSKWPQEFKKNMHNLGYRYDAPRIISGADVLVATAKQEPLGRTVIEAALAKTPVLAAKSGGFIEIFDSISPDYLVSPDNVNEFSKRFLDVENFINKSNSNLEAVQSEMKSKFDPISHLHEMLNIYRRHMDA